MLPYMRLLCAIQALEWPALLRRERCPRGRRSRPRPPPLHASWGFLFVAFKGPPAPIVVPPAILMTARALVGFGLLDIEPHSYRTWSYRHTSNYMHIHILCIYIYMYVSIFSSFMYKYTNTHMETNMSVYVRTYVRTYIRTYVRTHARTHARTYVRT